MDEINIYIRGAIIVFITILVCCAPAANSTEIQGVQRLTQFDVNSVQFGSRLASISLEVKSKDAWSTSRHCVLARLKDLTEESFQEISKKAGALVLEQPLNFKDLADHEKRNIYSLEQLMLSQSTPIPVYFPKYSKMLDRIIDEIGTYVPSKKSGSALSDMISLVSSNGYQLVASGASNSANNKHKISIIEGELIPSKIGKTKDDLPSIYITSNIKPFGVMNNYQINTDAAIFMIIMNFFSKLYSNVNTSPKYNLKFLLFESGSLLNFQGAKKWLEDKTQLQDLEFVLCLDTLIQPTILEKEESLYMHVSKPPKDNSVGNKFYKQLKIVAENQNITIEGVHKKINLADPQLAWEHERFGMKKMPSFTISGVKNYKSISRNTLFTEDEDYLKRTVQVRAKVLLETLIRYIYNIEESNEIITDFMNIDEYLVESWSQVKTASDNNDLKNAFEKYAKNVKIIHDKPENRDPDFMFYHGSEAVLNIYNVKPAIFDLFLTILISSYLFVLYMFVSKFGYLFQIINNYCHAE